MSSFRDRFGNLTVQQALEWNEAVKKSESNRELIELSKKLKAIYKSIKEQNNLISKGEK